MTTDREYRAAELAAKAGITPRTVRFYRERGLIPPPRRAGRVAWYGERHLARLRTIAALLERGHTLNGIAELSTAFEEGRDVADVLGLASGSEEAVRLTPEALADHFPHQVTPKNVSTALELGYLDADGDMVVHASRRLLEASSELVKAGVPLAAVLAAGRQVRACADALDTLVTDLLHTYLTPSEAVRARVLANRAVEADLALALGHRARSAANSGPARGE